VILLETCDEVTGALVIPERNCVENELSFRINQDGRMHLPTSRNGGNSISRSTE
jgi:hypothetical protein